MAGDQASDAPAESAGDAAASKADVAALRNRLDDVDAAFDEKIQDVRERVVQVKREADGKAPADHDHEALRERADEAATRVDELSAELETLRETVERVEADVDAGFGNYEEILEYLTETADALETKLDTLASALVETRTAAQTLAARAEATAAVDELAERANRKGVRAADCDDCGSRVDVALLTGPSCPHCGATFTDVEPKRGLFGSPTLVVGDRPALEAGDDPAADVADMLPDRDLDGLVTDDE